MKVNKKIIDIIKSEKTTRRLIYWFAFSVMLDVIITIYELTFMEGIREKNPLANHLIQKFGIIPGLLTSVGVEISFFASFYILLKKLLPGIPIYRGNWETILDGLWIVILLMAFILHFKAIVNNLLRLFI